MIRKSISTILILIIIFILVSLTGCGNAKDTQNDNLSEETIEQNNIETVENKSPIKYGQYNKELTEDDIAFGEGDIYIEIYENNITLVDNFAPIIQKGTFEIKDNKLIGTYTSAEYLNQSTGNMDTKSINEKFEFEILEDGSLKDNIGFGESFGNNWFKGAKYNLYLEYKDVSQWKDIYTEFAKKELKEADGAYEGETLLSPFVALIDLNFDDIPELLYYDASSYANVGDMDTYVYTIENGKVVYKTKIPIRRDEKFVKIDKDGMKLIVYYDDDNPPTNQNMNYIEDLTNKTLSGYASNYTLGIENENGFSQKNISEEEFNNISSKYFNNTDIIPETLKTYEFMEVYTDEQKTNIFETAAEEYENR